MKRLIATVGIDVCKNFLDISDGQRIVNTEVEVRRFLKRISSEVRFAYALLKQKTEFHPCPKTA